MTEQLRALTPLTEDLVLVFSTHMAAHNHWDYKSRGSNVLLWPPCELQSTWGAQKSRTGKFIYVS